jgi:kynurenine formamidase
MGWSRHWGTNDYLVGHPFLTEDAAESLRDSGTVLVGIDSLNVDSPDDGRRPVHTTLLGADTRSANICAVPGTLARSVDLAVMTRLPREQIFNPLSVEEAQTGPLELRRL